MKGEVIVIFYEVDGCRDRGIAYCDVTGGEGGGVGYFP